MGGIKIWHIVVLIIAFVLLFGWKNLPNAARSLGESMRVFKTEVDQMKDETAARKDTTGAAPPAPGIGHDGTGHDTHRPVDRRHDSSSDERHGERYRDTARDDYRDLQNRRADDDPAV